MDSPPATDVGIVGDVATEFGLSDQPALRDGAALRDFVAAMDTELARFPFVDMDGVERQEARDAVARLRAELVFIDETEWMFE